MNDITEIKSPYFELNLSNWNDFRIFIENRNGMPGYIFRGQNQASWELTPSINRINHNVNKLHVLHRYKMYTRERIEIPTSSSNAEYWAVGQHHKLKTPMLDWTASPYVAAYFAFREERKIELPKKINNDEVELFIQKCRKIINDECAIYCLNTHAVKDFLIEEIKKPIIDEISNGLISEKPNIINEIDFIAEETCDPTECFIELNKHFSDNSFLGKTIIFKDDIVESIFHSYSILNKVKSNFTTFPLEIFSPVHASNRLLNQRGLFVHWKSNESINDWVNKISFNKNILMKITLPISIAEESIDHLNSMNINQLSLFPDLDGAGEYCNDRLLKKFK